jgi:hypothetical protein
MLLLKEVVSQIDAHDEDKIYYVYLMHKPNGQVFYVGKGTARNEKDQRITYHEYESKLDARSKELEYRNMLKVNTIRKIWRDGGEIYYSIDSWHGEEADCFDREIELIAKFGRKITGDGKLTNLSVGGEGEAMSEHSKQKVFESLKKYYSDPTALKEMAERQKKYYHDNPELAIKMKKGFIENKAGEKLVQWIKDNPDKIAEKGKNHSQFMSEWHKTEEGKEVTRQNAIKRNEKFRTEEHRQHMANKTKEYIANNREAYDEVRKKVAEKKQVIVDYRANVLHILQDYLHKNGKVKRKRNNVTYQMLRNWKNKGIIPGTLPNGTTYDLKIWQDYEIFLNNLLNVPSST